MMICRSVSQRFLLASQQVAFGVLLGGFFGFGGEHADLFYELEPVFAVWRFAHLLGEVFSGLVFALVVAVDPQIVFCNVVDLAIVGNVRWSSVSSVILLQFI